jgi:hypothetical protein
MGMDAGTVIIAGATLVTAAATVVSAYVAWQMWRGQLTVDVGYTWVDENGQRRLELKLTVHNETSSIVDITTMEVLGAPVLDARSRREKHESWPANTIPVFKEVAPKKSELFGFYV